MLPCESSDRGQGIDSVFEETPRFGDEIRRSPLFVFAYATNRNDGTLLQVCLVGFNGLGPSENEGDEKRIHSLVSEAYTSELGADAAAVGLAIRDRRPCG